MIYPDFRLALYLIALFAILLLGFWLWLVRGKRSPRSRAVGIVGVILVVCILLVLVIGRLFGAHSVLIYSPDRKHAVQIVDTRKASHGGLSFVVLYSDHGLHVNGISLRAVQSITVEDIRWLSNSEVLLVGHDPRDIYSCNSPSGVTARCIPGPSPSGTLR